VAGGVGGMTTILLHCCTPLPRNREEGKAGSRAGVRMQEGWSSPDECKSNPKKFLYVSKNVYYRCNRSHLLKMVNFIN
jgi:hypothetical protein